MNSCIKNLKIFLDKSILIFCGFALLALVITVSWQVFSRYVLNDPSSFTEELSRYLMVWLGLLGASYLFGKKGHLAITLLADNIPRKLNILLQLMINALVLSFVSLAMIKGGSMLILKTMQQFSPALHIPMGYVYFILPISGCLMILYVLMNILEPIFKE